MKTISLNIPAKTQKKLDALTASGEIASLQEYLEELIDQDLEDRRLEALILEGMEGEATPLDDEAWADIRREAFERIKARKQAKHVESGKIAESPARYRRNR